MRETRLPGGHLLLLAGLLLLLGCTSTSILGAKGEVSRTKLCGKGTNGTPIFCPEKHSAQAGTPPGGAMRAESFLVHYDGDIQVRLVQPVSRVKGRDCGFQFVPIPPILPASIVRYGPSVFQVQASEVDAYEEALSLASNAHTLLDVQEKTSTAHFLIFTRTCVEVSGVPAKFVDKVK